MLCWPVKLCVERRDFWMCSVRSSRRRDISSEFPPLFQPKIDIRAPSTATVNSWFNRIRKNKTERITNRGDRDRLNLPVYHYDSPGKMSFLDIRKFAIERRSRQKERSCFTRVIVVVNSDQNQIKNNAYLSREFLKRVHLVKSVKEDPGRVQSGVPSPELCGINALM